MSAPHAHMTVCARTKCALLALAEARPAPALADQTVSKDLRVAIQLPPADGASGPNGESECSGAEHFELQTLGAGATDWRSVVSHSTAPSVTLQAPADLSAARAHRFRVILTNRIGVSTPGEGVAEVVWLEGKRL